MYMIWTSIPLLRCIDMDASISNPYNVADHLADPENYVECDNLSLNPGLYFSAERAKDCADTVLVATPERPCLKAAMPSNMLLITLTSKKTAQFSLLRSLKTVSPLMKRPLPIKIFPKTELSRFPLQSMKRAITVRLSASTVTPALP